MFRDLRNLLISLPLRSPTTAGPVFEALQERSLCGAPHAAASLYAGRQRAERIGLDLNRKGKCLGGIIECVYELHGIDERAHR